MSISSALASFEPRDYRVVFVTQQKKNDRFQPENGHFCMKSGNLLSRRH